MFLDAFGIFVCLYAFLRVFFTWWVSNPGHGQEEAPRQEPEVEVHEARQEAEQVHQIVLHVGLPADRVNLVNSLHQDHSLVTS